MKILKPGKVEMRKFVCPNCECEFVIYKSEANRSMDLDANYHYWAKCPCRDQIAWTRANPTWIGCADEYYTARDFVDSLIARGVTFKETPNADDHG